MSNYYYLTIPAAVGGMGLLVYGLFNADVNWARYKIISGVVGISAFTLALIQPILTSLSNFVIWPFTVVWLLVGASLISLMAFFFCLLMQYYPTNAS